MRFRMSVSGPKDWHARSRLRKNDEASESIGVRSNTNLPLVTLALAALCFLPAGLFYFFADHGVSSLAPGTIAACLIFLAIAISSGQGAISADRLANYVSLGVVIASVVLVHLVIADAIEVGGQPTRALTSLPVLMLMLAGAASLAALLQRNSPILDEAIAFVRWLLVGLDLLAIAGYHPWPGLWDKPVFPFSEPSHFALAANPFLMHACVKNRGLKRGLWIFGSLTLAYLGRSLTMMVGVAVAGVICLPVYGLIGVSAIAVLSVPLMNIRYFTDRLDFDAGVKNLSSLVYREGWELFGDAITRSSGWGVGFQQLGYAPFRSPSADAIYVILHNDLNLRDGGFLLAKLGSEFGIFGVLLIIAYLILATRVSLLARRVAQGTAPEIPSHIVLSLCSICTFSVDIFVRDVGYFSGSVLLFVSSLYMLWANRDLVRHIRAMGERQVLEPSTQS